MKEKSWKIIIGGVIPIGLMVVWMTLVFLGVIPPSWYS